MCYYKRRGRIEVGVSRTKSLPPRGVASNCRQEVSPLADSKDFVNVVLKSANQTETDNRTPNETITRTEAQVEVQLNCTITVRGVLKTYGVPYPSLILCIPYPFLILCTSKYYAPMGFS